MTKRNFTVTCDGLDDFGRGIVRLDKETCFIDDFLPGEVGEIQTTYAYGKLKEATLVRRTKDSPDRVQPACRYYPKCGGCQLMHLAYQKQLDFKTKKVRDLLHKFAKLDFDVSPTIGLDNPTRFRNKVQKPIRLSGGKLSAGFFENGTHKLVGIQDCLSESRLSNTITNVCLKLFRSFRYPAYDEDKGTGIIRHLLIKTSSDEKQALVTLVCTTSELGGKVNFAKALIEEVPEVVGVVININSRHTNVILGEKDVPVYGRSHLSDRIFNNTFLISSQSFYQTNARQIETLYGKAIEFAGLTRNDTVLDAYCGTGTIGLSCSPYVRQVIGVEINRSAVKDAIQNCRINAIRNARFLCEDATEYLLRTKDRYDVIIMDPPRKGSTPAFINTCKRIRPRTIVYVSCDPVTLARDLALFRDTYDVIAVQPVDMFPNSTHVETVVSLAQRHIKDSVLVSFTSEELPITKTEASATYQEIQKFIYDKHKIKVSTLDIAQVKEECGIKKRDSYNHPKSDKYEQPKVTEEKKTLIKEALKEFKML